MIHKFKTAEGKTTFLVYAYAHTHDRGYRVTRCGSFDSLEEAKDGAVAAHTRALQAYQRRLQVLQMAIKSDDDGESGCVESALDAIAQVSTEIVADSYFLVKDAEQLFDRVTWDDGVTTLHGEAAVEYARRHGHEVRHTDFPLDGGGNYSVNEFVSAGRAHELLSNLGPKEDLSLEVPIDTLTDDLPPSLSYFDRERAERKRPRTAAELREGAAMARKWAADFIADAEKEEARAAKMEARK